MKLKRTWWLLVLSAVFLAGGLQGKALAASEEPETIVEGVYVDEVSVAGMTAEEAVQAVESYIADLAESTITVLTDENEAKITMGELGLYWANPEIVDEALKLGKKGNLIERYKALEDLKHENHVYEVQFGLDDNAITSFIENQISIYDAEAKEPELTRKNGKFIVTEGTTGIAVNVEETSQVIKKAILEEWQGYNIKVDSVSEITKPKHTAEELSAVQDVLGTWSTNYSVSNAGRTKSLEASTRMLNGTVVFPGEEISVSTLMGDREDQSIYGVALGYEGTRTVDMVGAGICQTASTLYCAVLYSELEVTERYNHTKVVTYVPRSMDATIYAGDDYRNPNKDLKIRNNLEHPIYIEGSASGGTQTFTIYGKEYRSSDRKVEYISTTLEESYPTEIVYVERPDMPVGWQEQSQEAYPYVRSTLTKVVTENGSSTSTVIHTDKYKAANQEIQVGTAGAAPVEQPPADQQPADQQTQPAAQPPADQQTQPAQ